MTPLIARPVRYHLGAEELLELGRGNEMFAKDRRPYLSGRGPSLSQFDLIAVGGGFLAEGLSFAFNTMGDIVDVPLGILSQGVDVAFNGVAGVLSSIPILGELLAQILLLGGALIKFGLSIPGLALHGLGNVLGGVAKALKGSGTEAENQQKVDKAKSDITGRAPSEIKGVISQLLNMGGVSGKNLAPGVNPDGTAKAPPAGTVNPDGSASSPAGTDLESVLTVGIPVVGVVALIAALA